jgi:DNA polymerase (family 10)
MEINASPWRLDLPDRLVYEARASEIRCVINSDAHAVTELSNMPYGVTVARRGWCTTRDIINTYSVNDVDEWMKNK